MTLTVLLRGGMPVANLPENFVRISLKSLEKNTLRDYGIIVPDPRDYADGV